MNRRWRMAERSGLGVIVLVLAGGAGSAVAAATVGSVEILDNSLRSRDVKDGTLRLQDLAPATAADLRGPAGPPGARGEQGEQGDPAPSGTESIAETVGFYGPVATIAPNSGSYVFAGAPALVTISAGHNRVVGAATAALGFAPGSTPGFADVGMCFQLASGGTVLNFVGGNYTEQGFAGERRPYTATATVVLAPGSFQVGLCVRNTSTKAISNNNYVNGYVQVTE
jgi:hypothetical protein